MEPKPIRIKKIKRRISPLTIFLVIFAIALIAAGVYIAYRLGAFGSLIEHM